MNKLILIDFSSLLYSACYNCQVKESISDDFKQYKDTLDFYVQSIFDDTEATHYIAFGDGNTSFRKNEFKEFKADRTTKPKMKFFKELKEYAIDKYKLIIDSKLEADDMLLLVLENIRHIPDEWNILIASKDSDVPQIQGNFYNYSWRRNLYSHGKTPNKEQLKEGFENAFMNLNSEEAAQALWRMVLTKGHNNKYHFLKGCGKETAINYLKGFSTTQLKLAVLNAFINGINPKDYEGVKRKVKGYGLLKGIEWFNNAFRQSYLLRTLDEVIEVNSEFEIPTPIIIEKDELPF